MFGVMYATSAVLSVLANHRFTHSGISSAWKSLDGKAAIAGESQGAVRAEGEDNEAQASQHHCTVLTNKQ